METIVGLLFIISATLMANDAIESKEGSHTDGDFACAILDKTDSEVVKLNFTDCKR